MANYPVFAKSSSKKYKQRKITDFTKKVTGIAKKVVHREAETKSALNNSIPGNMFNDSVYAQNLNFFISQGSNAENVIGEKFYLKNIHIKGTLSNLVNINTGNTPLFYRLLVIRTKKPLTNSSSIITATDIFRSSNSIASLAHVDLHKVDLIKDITGKLTNPINLTNDQTRFDINLKINKTHFIDTDNGGYLKDKNYYLIFTAYKVDNPVFNVGFLSLNWSINFKDM